MTELTHRIDRLSFDEIRLRARDIKVRTIKSDDLWLSLRQGVADFSARSSLPFLILFYFLAALIISLFSSGQELRYLAFPIVAGFTLIGPMIAICFFEMSRRKEKGLTAGWRNAFKFVHSHSFAPILALSILMAVIYIFWLYLAELIYFGTFSENAPVSVGEFFNQLFTTRRGWALIAYGNFVGFLFAFTTMAVSLVAFPLVLDKPVTSITAIKVSIRAFTSNFWVLAVWGLLVVIVMTLGVALFLIGLAVALPVLGHATWHLYRKLIEE